MAYVICVCGAGGKTTLCYILARKYSNEKKSVCVVTTTHMWNNVEVSDINKVDLIDVEKIYTFGEIVHNKITPVNNDDYSLICKRFDYVIIEADGCKGMPFKIPEISKEPVIPDNCNEIVLVWTTSAIGRKISTICFRYNDFKDDHFILQNNLHSDIIVNESIIKKIYIHYYIENLQKKYPDVKISFYKVDIIESKNYLKYKKIVFGILASGESKRFGGKNKLLAEYGNKSLYQIVFDKVLSIKDIVYSEFKAVNSKIDIDIVIATSHNEILNDKYLNDNARLIKNENYKDGISSSIKEITNYALNDSPSDAITFFNADMPFLDEKEVANMIFYTMCSNDEIGAMANDVCMTPAFFSKKYFEEILKLEGDVGAKILFEAHKSEIYKYFTDNSSLIDIDTIKDYEKYIKKYE